MSEFEANGGTPGSGGRWAILILAYLAMAAVLAKWICRVLPLEPAGQSAPGSGDTESEAVDPSAGDEPDMPALELLQDFVKAAANNQLERSKSFDQRGGVLLGFAGILVGLVLRDLPSLGGWGMWGGGLATVAALLSATVILPNTAGGLNPRTMLEEYAAAPVRTARFRVLSTLADIFDVEEARINRKAQRLRIATLMLPVAGAILVIGAIVNIEPAEQPSAVPVDLGVEEVRDVEQAGQVGDQE
ncbi:hypothetical protein [Rhodococcus sp. SJ-3]|uniref:hypothetical protein n=1 Tax=Rhodococcus sp. SJ-3 TaxID=3454628 RepID=UPI003F7A8238